MELKLRDKVALVTAAGRGIGRAICLSLATEGARVFATSRTASDLESLLAAMGNDDGRHRSFAMDLAAPGSPEELVEILKASVGLPDIVVHNLGDTLGIKDPLCSMDDWDRVWRVNIGVSLELNRLIIPSMQERRWGRIVNIASTASLENNGPVTYCTAKAALAAYTRCMGRVLAPDGIVMAGIIVGAIFTDGGYWDKTIATDPQHVHKYIDERLPLKRFGRPEDIADMVSFLCSDRAQFCQGALIPVDGGQSRHFFSTV